jgi:predicted enzyme related to lactoylglutathione lyase
MIDHLGFSVSDYERAKAFYSKALAPLGYSLVKEVTAEQTGHEAAAGFGAGGKPDFWIGGEGALNKPVHVAILAKDRATVDAFYKAAMAAGTMGRPASARIIMRTITAPSCAIPTATTSKPSATRRNSTTRQGTSTRHHRCRFPDN